MSPENAAHLPESESLEIAIRVSGSVTVIDLPRIVRRTVAEKLGSLLAFILRSQPPMLLLNFTKVDRIESAGIAACLFAYRRSQENTTRLALFGVTDPVMRLFTIARIDSLFTFHPDEAAALRAAESAPEA